MMYEGPVETHIINPLATGFNLWLILWERAGERGFERGYLFIYLFMEILEV